ncbi:uncharacterized protein SCHCODRAFT_02577691 [Schizophyllum commune H4-8]|uniref:Uncharacterized protein n=1 Tax=Schizophyllum commune (strain H4-8 / FGSC 9210) TaxID=578458 RepID=D8Q5Z2_SCHCM|nr:uncharacterized protein SCHCODRAFT_02577691 [Schizophyllum commune H4-8]KAI5891964.1 hypothetical protein SCHCODRAFT_02577691 [Schizophyllum commune H4-8]
MFIQQVAKCARPARKFIQVGHGKWIPVDGQQRDAPHESKSSASKHVERVAAEKGHKHHTRPLQPPAPMVTELVKKPFSAVHRVEMVVVEAQVAVVEDWPLQEPSVVATQDPVPRSVAPRGNKPKGPRANTVSQKLPAVVTVRPVGSVKAKYRPKRRSLVNQLRAEGKKPAKCRPRPSRVQDSHK